MDGPDSGLAMAIGLAMICMVSVPGLIGGALGYFVSRAGARRSGDGASRPWLTAVATVGGLVVGVAGGILAILFTFFESKFDPVLVLEVSSDVPRDEIYVVVDPTASGTIEVGTFSREARVTVPASGVVRVGDAGDFTGGPLNARLSTGATNVGASSSPTAGGGYILCFSFTPWSPGGESCGRAGPELEAHIEALEN